ncbi:cannabinoid receptor 2 [Nematostella vectensis]|uniref:cannabinoid receptor 2 n=1 Tax=Nematostella vectensis TaxID=45351 RepID=UPI00139005B6|nr:cannabinoid receptor 2 [Nematostella vectensis]
MVFSNNTTAASESLSNSSNSPVLGRCYIPGGPPVDWQKSYRFHTAAGAVALSIILVSVCISMNGMILISVLRRFAKVRPSALFVGSLALSDFLFGIISNYAVLNDILRIIHGGACTPAVPLTVPYHVGYHLCFISSIGSMALMSIDCYLCVARPMSYRLLVNMSRVTKALLVLWLLVIIHTTAYYVSYSETKTILISVVSSCVAVIIVIFEVLTFVSYKAHNTAVADRFQHQIHHMEMRNHVNERKVAIAVAFVISTLMIGYFPRIIQPIISKAVGFNVAHLMSTYSSLCLLGCAAVRPIVTYAKNSHVRNNIKAMFGLRRADDLTPATFQRSYSTRST